MGAMGYHGIHQESGTQLETRDQPDQPTRFSDSIQFCVLSAQEGLTKALMHAGRYAEGFDRLEETFLNQAFSVRMLLQLG